MPACHACKKKVSLVAKITNTCKCAHTFCDTHKFPESHMCSFDYQKSAKEYLAMLNPIVIASKVDII